MHDVDQFPSQDTFEVEITDLDSSERAGNALPAYLERMLLCWQRPERRRERRWFGGCLTVCLALLLLAALLSPSTGVTALLAGYWPFTHAQPSLAAILASQPASRTPNTIVCPVEAAWSPNSSFVAVLGYTQPCSQQEFIPAQINVYRRVNNASLALPFASWQPDGDILRALLHSPDISPRTRALLSRKPFPGQVRQGTAPAIEYMQMLWSPDSAHLATSFEVVTSITAYTGLFVASSTGKQARILLHAVPPGFDPRQAPPLVWDLQHGNATSLVALKPALAYSWDARDRLIPTVPLTVRTNLSTYASSPTGNPDGGRSFTVWQPGHPTILSFLHTPAFLHSPSVYAWSTSFAAWSPDERYLVTNFAFTGLMEPPGRPFPATQMLAALRANDLPRVPPHDPVLISASFTVLAVAWNPSGTLLAMYNRTDSIDIYNCQTGQLLQTLKPPRIQPLSGSAVLLRWSPDSRSLLISSAQWGLMNLWGPDRLAH